MYTTTNRSEFGTKTATAARKAGQVPVTLSNSGKPSSHVFISKKDAEKIIGGDQVASFDIDGKEVKALFKDYAVHPITDVIQQLDFLTVTDDTVVKTSVNIIPDTLKCPGIKSGGILEQMVRKIMVKCKAKDLPNEIHIDLSSAEVGDTIYSGECSLPEGVSLITKPRVAMLSVLKSRGMKKDASADALEEKLSEGETAEEE